MELILNSRLDLREKNNDKITIMKIKRKNDSKRTMKEIGYIYLTLSRPGCFRPKRL